MSSRRTGDVKLHEAMEHIMIQSPKQKWDVVSLKNAVNKPPYIGRLATDHRKHGLIQEVSIRNCLRSKLDKFKRDESGLWTLHASIARKWKGKVKNIHELYSSSKPPNRANPDQPRSNPDHAVPAGGQRECLSLTHAMIRVMQEQKEKKHWTIHDIGNEVNGDEFRAQVEVLRHYRIGGVHQQKVPVCTIARCLAAKRHIAFESDNDGWYLKGPYTSMEEEDLKSRLSAPIPHYENCRFTGYIPLSQSFDHQAPTEEWSVVHDPLVPIQVEILHDRKSIVEHFLWNVDEAQNRGSMEMVAGSICNGWCVAPELYVDAIISDIIRQVKHWKPACRVYLPRGGYLVLLELNFPLHNMMFSDCIEFDLVNGNAAIESIVDYICLDSGVDMKYACEISYHVRAKIFEAKLELKSHEFSKIYPDRLSLDAENLVIMDDDILIDRAPFLEEMNDEDIRRLEKQSLRSQRAKRRSRLFREDEFSPSRIPNALRFRTRDATRIPTSRNGDPGSGFDRNERMRVVHLALKKFRDNNPHLHYRASFRLMFDHLRENNLTIEEYIDGAD